MSKTLKAADTVKKRAPVNTADALEILAKRDRNDPELDELKQEARRAMEVGQLAYDVRIRAKLSQAQLAKKIGATAAAIDDLEMANYSGDYYGMLDRIARALGQELSVGIQPAPSQRQSA